MVMSLLVWVRAIGKAYVLSHQTWFHRLFSEEYKNLSRFWRKPRPASAKGAEEIRQTAKDSRLAGTSLILSSPYTRALQTAAILSKELQAEIVVETDLHEWMANKNYIYETDKIAENSYHEFAAMGGNYADGKERDWEDLAAMRKRMLRV